MVAREKSKTSMTGRPARPGRPRGGRAWTNEPLWWGLFVLGGTAALLMPVMIVITGVAVFAGWFGESGLLDLLRSPLVRIYLFVIMAFPLYHAAHRIRLVLRDTGLRRWDRSWLSWGFYGAATAGAVASIVLLLLI